VVTVSSAGQGQTGLYRSTNGGNTFTLISGTAGLPTGPIYALGQDPGEISRLYVAVADEGVFTSANLGAAWTDITGTGASMADVANADNFRFAAGPGGVVFLAVDKNGQLDRVYRGGPSGGWVAMDVPGTLEPDFIGIHPGFQGSLHLSLAADPF